ncbi:winged helix-turn-helix domain-containing protein [Terracidiphilus gabretensis]|jgi:Tol biopolymer transport system component/DNA-binding winged helix-turn-helix (wHTH) protein|uniref:winged helix-turn-helix domain-containing protein n=1 Tax=Terracidiphilus gabretensis TaxID=1577687 RepID=UPI00071C1D8F|nr:winged helix-turn-helix domain-containing protein [Terracidiphilus gabretensis]
MRSGKAASRLAFGLYEVDLSTGELWRAGRRIKLQSQPFKVLTLLLEHAGEIVTREELQFRLWGNDTIVDFDHSLATAINKIREALRDSADNPRFVETLARRGYRFIAPVNPVTDEHSGTIVETPEMDSAADHATASGSGAAVMEAPAIPAVVAVHEGPVAVTVVVPAPGSAIPVAIPAVKPRETPIAVRVAALALVVGAVGVLAGYFFGVRAPGNAPVRISPLTQNGHLAVGSAITENFTASVTDGYRIFVQTLEGGKSTIATVPISGGTPVNLSIPNEVTAPTLGDISPDGSQLLLRNHLSPESEQPLWVVPVDGGSALRVGAVLAHDATWMPSSAGTDGHGILYAAGNDLYRMQGTSSQPEHYASVPGRAFWLRWNPAGKLLRFTVLDPIAHTQTLWQLSAGDRTPKPVLTGFSEPASECCGVWTADGRAYVFQSGRGGNTDLWRLSGNSATNPARLTYGPLQFQSVVASRTGETIYFLGVDTRFEVYRVTADGALAAERGFLGAADRVAWSRDKQWVAWTDSAGRLWRAAADGTQKIQLTPDAFNVFMARWSPDGQRLAIMAKQPGKAWQIYLVAASGGDVQPVLKELRNAADPSWSADGQSLVYGRVNDALGKESSERTLDIVNLKTGKIEVIPGSDGLFSPRWSPDGRYIAALTLDQRQVRLYDVAAKTWKTLPGDSGADPAWSSDSRYLYVHRSLDPSQPIDRIAIPGGQMQELIKLAGSSEGDAVDYVFVGLTQDDMPLIRARTYTGNMYSMQLK